MFFLCQEGAFALAFKSTRFPGEIVATRFVYCISYRRSELNLICILKPFTLFLSTRKNVSIYKIYLRVVSTWGPMVVMLGFCFQLAFNRLMTVYIFLNYKHQKSVSKNIVHGGYMRCSQAGYICPQSECQIQSFRAVGHAFPCQYVTHLDVICRYFIVLCRCFKPCRLPEIVP